MQLFNIFKGDNLLFQTSNTEFKHATLYFGMHMQKPVCYLSRLEWEKTNLVQITVEMIEISVFCDWLKEGPL